MPNDSGGSLSVESPIFDYANFERLEHEGRLEFGRQVEQLRKKPVKDFSKPAARVTKRK